MSNLDLNCASPPAYSWRFLSRRCSRDVESRSKLGQSNSLAGALSLSRRCSRDVESGSKLGQSNCLAGALFPEDAAEMSNLDLNLARSLELVDAAEMSNLDLNSASPTAYRWYSLSRRCSRDVESGSKLRQSTCL